MINPTKRGFQDVFDNFSKKMIKIEIKNQNLFIFLIVIFFQFSIKQQKCWLFFWKTIVLRFLLRYVMFLLLKNLRFYKMWKKFFSPWPWPLQRSPEARILISAISIRSQSLAEHISIHIKYRRSPHFVIFGVNMKCGHHKFRGLF